MKNSDFSVIKYQDLTIVPLLSAGNLSGDMYGNVAELKIHEMNLRCF